MADTNPLVSIITVNFNQTQVTRELLQSLENITYEPTEVIVVDNGSSDNSACKLCNEFPKIKFISTGENLGFAGGNNVGIKSSFGEFILLINNDVEVTRGFLEPLVNTLKMHENAGIVSPKIIYHGTDERIQYAGSSRISPFTGRGVRIGYGERDTGKYDRIYRTALGHGACLLFRRSLLDKIGLLPEQYFLYYEEHDWTENAKRAGFDVFYVGVSTVYHKESTSTGKNSPLKTYYLSRNRMLFMKNNTSFLTNLVFTVFTVLFSVPKNTVHYLIRRDFDNLKAYLNGVLWRFK